MQATPILTVALGAALLLTTPAMSGPGTPSGAGGGLVPFLQPQTPAARATTEAPSPVPKVGERYPDAHVITEPGRYGLSVPPDGTRYAVIGRSLVRIDAKTFKVQSVLRMIEGRRD